MDTVPGRQKKSNTTKQGTHRTRLSHDVPGKECLWKKQKP